MQLQQARATDKQQKVALRGRCSPGRHLQTPFSTYSYLQCNPAAPLLSHLRAVCRTKGSLSQAHPPMWKDYLCLVLLVLGGHRPLRF